MKAFKSSPITSAMQVVLNHYGAFKLEQDVFLTCGDRNGQSLFCQNSLMYHVRGQLEWVENELLQRYCIKEYHKFCGDCHDTMPLYPIERSCEVRLELMRKLVMKSDFLPLGLQYYFMGYISLLEASHTALVTENTYHPDVVQLTKMAKYELGLSQMNLDKSSVAYLEVESLLVFFTYALRQTEDYKTSMKALMVKWQVLTRVKYSVSLASVLMRQFIFVGLLTTTLTCNRWLLNLSQIQLSAGSKSRHYRLSLLSACRKTLIYRKYHNVREVRFLDEELLKLNDKELEHLEVFIESNGLVVCLHKESVCHSVECSCDIAKIDGCQPLTTMDFSKMDWLIKHAVHFGAQTIARFEK